MIMSKRNRSDEDYALVRSRLGELGEARLRRFIDYACPLSVDSMLDFLANNRFQTTPSIFLIDEANIQLAWEDGSGSLMGVDFKPSPVLWRADDE
jgi:hypothetical protein